MYHLLRFMLTNAVDPLQNKSLSISFQPLYEAIHIHSSLGKGEELRDTYDTDRRKQMDLLIPASLNINEHTHELQDLLANIAGFAIIERATSVKVQTFRTASEVESLWEAMCARVIDLIADTVAKILDSKVLLSVRDALELFMQTVQVIQVQLSGLTFRDMIFRQCRLSVICLIYSGPIPMSLDVDSALNLIR